MSSSKSPLAVNSRKLVDLDALCEVMMKAAEPFLGKPSNAENMGALKDVLMEALSEGTILEAMFPGGIPEIGLLYRPDGGIVAQVGSIHVDLFPAGITVTRGETVVVDGTGRVSESSRPDGSSGSVGGGGGDSEPAAGDDPVEG